MKTITLAIVLVMAWGKSFCQAGPTHPVHLSMMAQASEYIAASSQRPGTNLTKEAAIRKLLELQGITGDLNRLPAELLDGTARTISGRLPPGQYRERFVNLFLVRLKQKMGGDDILNVALRLYDKNFSQSEINDLISFYNSPLQRKETAVNQQTSREAKLEADKLLLLWCEEALSEVMNENPDLRKEFNAAAKRDSKH